MGEIEDREKEVGREEPDKRDRRMMVNYGKMKLPMK